MQEKKYGETIEEILKHKSQLEEKFDELFNSGEIIEKLENEKAQLVKDNERAGFKYFQYEN